MSDLTSDHTIVAAIAGIVGSAATWFLRGLGFGKEWGRVDAELKALNEKFDRLETRINAHLDRRD